MTVSYTSRTVKNGALVSTTPRHFDATVARSIPLALTPDQSQRLVITLPTEVLIQQLFEH